MSHVAAVIEVLQQFELPGPTIPQSYFFPSPEIETRYAGEGQIPYFEPLIPIKLSPKKPVQLCSYVTNLLSAIFIITNNLRVEHKG